MSTPIGSSDLQVEPFFFGPPRGRLFAVHHRPRNGAEVRGHVLCVPAFNEEMNRCRSMVTEQAKAFAAKGFGTLVFDLHGTGDSDGHFRDARWADWLDNVTTALGWLSGQPGGVKAILGTRLGALLAAQAYAQRGDPHCALLLWQPVLDGKIHLTQFLRVRMAAQLDRPDLPKETTTAMRQQLAAGEAVEVAGYEIHPELAHALDHARLGEQRLFAGANVLWLENASADKPELPPVSVSALGEWRAAGARVDGQTYTGPAFWQAHERVLASSLIDKTTAWLDTRVTIP
jgi:exosortase A-associated hydrolase 2